jgi:hypothetical protein
MTIQQVQSGSVGRRSMLVTVELSRPQAEELLSLLCRRPVLVEIEADYPTAETFRRIRQSIEKGLARGDA